MKKEATFNKGDVLKVLWIDAIMLDSDNKKTKWVKEAKLKKYCNSLLVIKSVGQCVYMGKNYLALSMCEKRRMVGPHQLIPLSSIVEIKKMKG